MKKMQEGQLKTQDGKVFAYVYTMEDDSFELQKDAFNLFSGKLLNFGVFVLKGDVSLHKCILPCG